MLNKMAVANVSNMNILDSNILDNMDSTEEKTVSSQKQIKEEINQSLVDSSNSSEGAQTNCKVLGMSKNIASKLNELSSNAEQTKNSNSHNEPNSQPKKLSKKDLGVRATPKQVFPNIACLPAEENFINCFILSVWDNIVGPQTVYVWKKKSKLKIQNLEKNNLRGDSEPNKTNEEKGIDSSKYPESEVDKSKTINGTSVSGRRVLLRSHTFSEGESQKIDSMLKARREIEQENRRHQPSKLCLSTIVKYVTEHTVNVGESTSPPANKMVFFFLSVPHQNIIILSVRFSIMEEGVGVPYSLSAVIPSHAEHLLLPTLDLIRTSMYRLAANIRLFITKEGLESGDKVRRELQELCTTLSSLRKANLTIYPISTLSRIPDDRRLAERMLTSHLQTMGTSLIIANSPNEANRVVMWLGQFLSDDDSAVSRIALSDGMWPFQAGVLLQAVIRDASGSIDLSSSKLLASNRPLTLIDLGTNSIRQMAPMNIHSKNSSATLRMQLMAHWHDLDHVPAPSQSLFEAVEATAPLVKRFLHEWDTLASCEVFVKKSFLQTFLRSLQYTALSVIMWVRYEWNNKDKKKKKDTKSLLAALSSTFLLEEQDLKIILAQAEALEPGFISALYTNQ